MTIYDRFHKKTRTVHTVVTDGEGIIVEEFSWMRSPYNGGIDGPLGYLDENIANLVGFRKRTDQVEQRHPGT